MPHCVYGWGGTLLTYCCECLCGGGHTEGALGRQPPAGREAHSTGLPAHSEHWKRKRHTHTSSSSDTCIHSIHTTCTMYILVHVQCSTHIYTTHCYLLWLQCNRSRYTQCTKGQTISCGLPLRRDECWQCIPAHKHNAHDIQHMIRAHTCALYININFCLSLPSNQDGWG